MIAFACPHCGHKENVSDDQTGKPVSCPRCGRLSDLPDAAVVPQPAAEAETVDIPKPNLTGDPAEPPTLAPTQPHPPLSAGPPARIDIPGYEILGELGRGGMGIIYKARQLHPRRLVALKMILAGEYADADALARFHREAEAAARLSHPNIVQLYQVGEHEGRPYLTLELVEGRNLAQSLREKPCDFRSAAELVLALARAIQFAHDHGIIHRDLKPANILLASDGTPKITDFGLAKQIEGSMTPAAKTQSGAILGTPSYMAPEQAEGKSQNIGRPADIYALGAILYELLSRQPPFQAETMIDTLVKVATEEPVPPRKLRKKCPRDLETICLKCLRKNPKQRYASAGDLANDLRCCLDGEAIKARPAGKMERVGRFLRRRKSCVFLAIGCAIPSFLVMSSCLFFMVLGFLVAPRVQSEADRLSSSNNLKQLQVAMRNFHEKYHCLPPSAITDRKTGKPLLSWRIAILPFIEQELLYEQFKLEEPWDSPHNSKLLRHMPQVFKISDAKQSHVPTICFFQVFVGPGTAFEPQTKVHEAFGHKGLSIPNDFPDGTRNTILIVEAAQGVPWTKPDDLPYDPQQPLPQLGGAFKDGTLVSMADGSVRFIKPTASESTLRALITRNDGQDPGNDW